MFEMVDLFFIQNNNNQSSIPTKKAKKNFGYINFIGI